MLRPKGPYWPINALAPRAFMRPAIVVPAFNRPVALRRLLVALLRADYSNEAKPVPLVISLEGNASPDVRALARELIWPHGPLEILEQPAPLGLKAHILACGDLAARFGSVVLLEDDLAVAPGFYAFAREACAVYDADDRIGGISLYAFLFNEFGGFPFLPMDDGLDLYFTQSASSWGQAWTKSQWSAFRIWLDGASDEAINSDLRIPEAVRAWPGQSWKRLYNAYLVDTGRYFAVPRFSMSTNMGDEGTHFQCIQTHHTAPLPVRPRRVRLTSLDESLCRYDAYFELEPECLNSVMSVPFQAPFSIDFHGLKPLGLLARAPWTLTVRAQPGTSIQNFGLRFLPPELNACYQIQGDFFALAPSDKVLPRLIPEKRQALRHFFMEKAPLPPSSLQRRAQAIQSDATVSRSR